MGSSTCRARRICSRVCGIGPSAALTTRIPPSICSSHSSERRVTRLRATCHQGFSQSRKGYNKTGSEFAIAKSSAESFQLPISACAYISLLVGPSRLQNKTLDSMGQGC